MMEIGNWKMGGLGRRPGLRRSRKRGAATRRHWILQGRVIDGEAQDNMTAVIGTGYGVRQLAAALSCRELAREGGQQPGRGKERQQAAALQTWATLTPPAL